MKSVSLLLALISIAAGSMLPTGMVSTKLGFCSNPPILPDFKLDQFFSGKWYVWRRNGNPIFEGFGSCAGTDMRVNETEIELLHFYYNPILMRYISIRGEASRMFSRFGGLQFPVDYSIVNNIHITIPYSIIGTDYNNWAVVYFCRQLLGVKIETSWVMMRKRGATDSSGNRDGIRSSLKTINQDLEDFSQESTDDCPVDEPHL